MFKGSQKDLTLNSAHSFLGLLFRCGSLYSQHFLTFIQMELQGPVVYGDSAEMVIVLRKWGSSWRKTPSMSVSCSDHTLKEVIRLLSLDRLSF